MRCGLAKAAKPKILPTRALREFAQRNGGRTVFDSYRLAQDSWATFARGQGYDVVHGDPTETGREHLSPEQYGTAVNGAADYVAHRKVIAKSIDRRTRKLAKENAKGAKAGRSEARRRPPIGGGSRTVREAAEAEEAHRLRPANEKLERDLRDSRAETAAAMRRCRLATQATKEAAETIAGDATTPTHRYRIQCAGRQAHRRIGAVSKILR